MTVEAMSSLPMQAGGAVAAAAGRTALWVVSAYMRAPLRNTALAALIGLSAMAGANALYRQAHHHPSPMFGSFTSAPATTKPAPIVPAKRPKVLSEPISSETTGSVEQPAAVKTIGTDEVAALQTQLKAMQLFTGSVDGLFGPRTAKAIKAFEAKAGRQPRGLLTPQIIALIKATPIPDPVPQVEIAPATAAQATEVAAAGPAQTDTITPLALTNPVKPLPAPQPLAAKTEEPVQVATADPAPLTPDATPIASDAGPAPITAPLKRVVSTVAIRVAPAAAGDSMPPPLTADTDVPPATDSAQLATDSKTIAAVQRGLNSLGFLHGEISGVADEATAKAIRNFEVYFNYDVSGRITRSLVNVLVQNGAVI
jgi:peptidoglycan hydrolase-like protein with peptidoglycan-binding domain